MSKPAHPDQMLDVVAYTKQQAKENNDLAELSGAPLEPIEIDEQNQSVLDQFMALPAKEQAHAMYLLEADKLPDFTPEEAVESLEPEQMDDARLVTLIKGIGPPPRLKAAIKGKGGRGRMHIGQDQKAWFLQFIATMPSVTLAATLLGVNRNSLYWHRDRDETFGLAWRHAWEIGNSLIEDVINEEAYGYGVRHVVTGKGEVLTIPKERNDKILLAKLALENMEKINKHTVEHGGGVIVIPQPLSAEEFEKVAFAQQQRHREGHTAKSVIEGSIAEAVPDGDTPSSKPKIGGRLQIGSATNTDG